MATKPKKGEQAYIVVKPNTLNYEVGDVVNLTEEQAAKLVNKVRLRDQIPGASAAGDSGKQVKELQEQVKELTEKLEAAEAKVAELESAQGGGQQ